nr:HD family phosphohydrolase [Pleionea sp. CnH1-48]
MANDQSLLQPLSEIASTQAELLVVSSESLLDYQEFALLLWQFSEGDDHQLPPLADGYCGLVVASHYCEGVDLVLTPKMPPLQWQTIWQTAIKFWQAYQQRSVLEQEVAEHIDQKHEIAQIGIALSAQKELAQLLDLILTEGRKLAHCEAASLYLIETLEDGQRQLRFKLFQNEKLALEVQEKSFPLNCSSIAGYVATTGEILNIPDVYQLNDSAPYQFDASFDCEHGYRTREVIAIPMLNHNQQIIGVLQFLNRKSEELQGLPFDEAACEVLMALASQSAVSIDNSRLLENIRELFEGFVSAAVTAIEARDPVTSGHSFRVAEYTCLLAEHLPHVQKELECSILSVDQMRELRYAALLHDFGKVGVSERVLQKSKKLEPSQLELIELRGDFLKEKWEREFYQEALRQRETSSDQNYQSWYTHHYSLLDEQLKQLSFYQSLIRHTNEPSVLHKNHREQLEQLSTFLDEQQKKKESLLLSDQELLSLSVTKGSLTTEERDEIQSHVNHTFEFLQKIPWTPDLAGIPEIAIGHHEKLDGSGYPFGLKAEQIPVQTRIMTIADIYDALTARDRPYKPAVPNERALNILNMEASDGKLDSHLVKLFIDARIYEKVRE